MKHRGNKVLNKVVWRSETSHEIQFLVDKVMEEEIMEEVTGVPIDKVVLNLEYCEIPLEFMRLFDIHKFHSESRDSI
ncbi:hypothetical protein Tco_0260473 [Tanacetum coccineum]